MSEGSTDERERAAILDIARHMVADPNIDATSNRGLVARALLQAEEERRAAVADEREACALAAYAVAEKYRTRGNDQSDANKWLGALEAEDAIRARSKQ